MQALRTEWDKWCEWMHRVRDDLVSVVDDRATFNGFRELVEKNGDWIDELEGGHWIDFVKRSYACAAFVGIRRQVRTDEQSISLAKIIKQMAANARRITYGFYCQVHPEPAAGGRVWQRHAFATISEDGEVVSADILAKDLGSLNDLKTHVEEVIDRTVVHLDKRLPEKTVTFDDLANSIEKLNEIACKYHVVLTGVGYPSLETSILFDWRKILRNPLVRPA